MIDQEKRIGVIGSIPLRSHAGILHITSTPRDLGVILSCLSERQQIPLVAAGPYTHVFVVDGESFRDLSLSEQSSLPSVSDLLATIEPPKLFDESIRYMQQSYLIPRMKYRDKSIAKKPSFVHNYSLKPYAPRRHTR